MVLILGVLSLVVCGLIGPFAWVMGKNDLAKMRAGQMDPRGENETRIGMILGIVASALILISLVFLVLWFVFVGVIVAGGAAGGR